MTNARTARAWIAGALGDEAVGEHFAAVSTALDKVAAFGIDAGPRVRLLGLGRRPLLGLVGDRPAADDRDRARAGSRSSSTGARAMDEHFRDAPLEQNMPVLLGLRRHLVPQRPGLPDPRGAALRPAAARGCRPICSSSTWSRTASA